MAARELGHHLAALDIRLIYGGGAIGLMGEVASGVAERGGKITGVIPEFLRKREIAFNDAEELIITEDSTCENAPCSSAGCLCRAARRHRHLRRTTRSQHWLRQAA